MTRPENRLTTGRDNVGRFVKGVSGNLGGRPKGLSQYVREQTGDGKMLVDKVLHLLRHPRGKGIAAQKFQLECIQWLADRGFGKAMQSVEHRGMMVHPWEVFRDMSTEDLRTLVEAGRALRDAKAEVIEGEATEIRPGGENGPC